MSIPIRQNNALIITIKSNTLKKFSQRERENKTRKENKIHTMYSWLISI